jgi:cobalt/nickel transport system permease protein
VAAVGLFSATTDWGAITGALKIFLLPDLFILVLDATIRYIDLLGGLSLSMLHALKLRSVGRNRMKTASLSGIAGSLFLRSRAMAEEMHAAMECRCFTGRYRIGRAARVSPSDIWPLAADAAILFVFIASGA